MTSKTKDRLAFAALVVALGWFAIHAIHHRAKAAEAESLQNARDAIALSALAEAAKQYGASTNWDSALLGQHEIRMSPIMTAELQKLWIAQPIAFVGQIVDVESIGSGHDRVTINAESMMNGYQFIEDLRLSLVAPEAKMDAFIAANPESAHGNGLTNAVAVIARVSGITTQPVAMANCLKFSIWARPRS
jgi:hypothetical protein